MIVRLMAGENRRFLPGLCNILGTLFIIAVIAAFLPMTVPRLLGFEVYEVISESMEPAIPVGSAVYVKAVEPETLSEGDVIAFHKGDSIITHRIVENRAQESALVTKGDANNKEDMAPVPYNAVIGRVEVHIPVIGTMMALLSEGRGKLYAMLVLFWGIMLYILSGMLRSRGEKENEK